MKRKLLKLTTILALFSFLFTGCSDDRGYDGSDSGRDDDRETSDGGDRGSGSGNGQDQGNAGIVTAGEWNDLDNWEFWSGLMTERQDNSTNQYDFGDKSAYWRFYTNNRLAIYVGDSSGEDANNVKLELKCDDVTIWKAVTDNLGTANLWFGMNEKESMIDPILPLKFTITINGNLQNGELQFTSWADKNEKLNRYIIAPTIVAKIADVAFIVDATGSMGDEIDFLKADLKNIIGQVSALQTDVTIRTAALFYRDTEDDYLTRHSNFSDDTNVTSRFINNQKASGGGDNPEAVHTALEHTLQNLSWSEDATARIAFLFLDAPAHKRESVLNSLHSSIKLFAANGIKIIPVAASGADKNTEFMSRFFSIATNGTYVFITNDSGVGNDHIEATVGDYQVEQLNDLIVRLINKYIK